MRCTLTSTLDNGWPWYDAIFNARREYEIIYLLHIINEHIKHLNLFMMVFDVKTFWDCSLATMIVKTTNWLPAQYICIYQ